MRLMRPLVRVMLHHGMAYGDFAEMARKAFVEEGFAYLVASDRRPTVSGVSALTGLTRKEATRLRDLDWDDDSDSGQRYNRAIRVISGWAEDVAFRDDSGEPAALPLEGDENSFSALVKKYSGDIPYVAMLTVLENSGTVEVADGRVTLKERAYIPNGTSADKINILGTDVGELIATIAHNLQANSGQLLFQRKVSNHKLRPEAVEEFRQLSNLKSQELLEEYDRWLAEREVGSDQTGEYVAVGIYYTDGMQEVACE